jgi:hypothetical protein
LGGAPSLPRAGWVHDGRAGRARAPALDPLVVGRRRGQRQQSVDRLQGGRTQAVRGDDVDLPVEAVEQLQLELGAARLLGRALLARRGGERHVHPLGELRRHREAHLGEALDLGLLHLDLAEVAEQDGRRERDEALGALGEALLQPVDDVEHEVARLGVHPPLKPRVAPAREREVVFCGGGSGGW